MPDICTLNAVVFQTLVACMPSTICTSEPIDGKLFCQPGPVLNLDCNRPAPPTYTCKRPDGTAYQFPPEQK